MSVAARQSSGEACNLITVGEGRKSLKEVVVIGGGFAGVEAAWQAAQTGARVRLCEMRPVRQTPAHRTDRLAEIVCSNSLKSDEPGTAPYLLKEEVRRRRPPLHGGAGDRPAAPPHTTGRETTSTPIPSS